jgi:hypothetical protein
MSSLIQKYYGADKRWCYNVGVSPLTHKEEIQIRLNTLAKKTALFRVAYFRKKTETTAWLNIHLTLNKICKILPCFNLFVSYISPFTFG